MLLLLVSGGTGYLWLRTSLPRIDGEIRLPGLSASVEVIRDHNAIPHIYAQSEHDMYFALGFIHAQDRLFQMEFMRRIGSGRASEIMGARAVIPPYKTNTRIGSTVAQVEKLVGTADEILNLVEGE